MTSRANETKVQRRKDGQCFTAVPAFVRDDMRLRGGSLLRWTPLGPGRWQVEVSGFEEPERRKTDAP